MLTSRSALHPLAKSRPTIAAATPHCSGGLRPPNVDRRSTLQPSTLAAGEFIPIESGPRPCRGEFTSPPGVVFTLPPRGVFTSPGLNKFASP